MISKLFGLVIVLVSLMCAYLFETTSGTTGAFRIFHWPAIILTGIGPIGFVMLCSDWIRLKVAFRFLTGITPGHLALLIEKEQDCLKEVSLRYYQTGPRAFQGVDHQISPSLAETFKKLSLHMPTKDVKEQVEHDKAVEEADMIQAIKVFSLGVRLAPSVGMLGTILGMVQLLAHLHDPSQIGSHMSLALLTTFYGLFFSLIFWTPLQQRVERLLAAKNSSYRQHLRWLELLENRKPIQYLGSNKSNTEASVKTNQLAPT